MDQRIKDFLFGGLTIVIIAPIVLICIFVIVYGALFLIGFTLVNSANLIGKELTILWILGLMLFVIGGYANYSESKRQRLQESQNKDLKT